MSKWGRHPTSAPIIIFWASRNGHMLQPTTKRIANDRYGRQSCHIHKVLHGILLQWSSTGYTTLSHHRSLLRLMLMMVVYYYSCLSSIHGSKPPSQIVLCDRAEVRANFCPWHFCIRCTTRRSVSRARATSSGHTLWLFHLEVNMLEDCRHLICILRNLCSRLSIPFHRLSLRTWARWNLRRQ